MQPFSCSTENSGEPGNVIQPFVRLGTGGVLDQELYEDFSLSNPALIIGFSWQQHDLGALQMTRVSIYAGLPEACRITRLTTTTPRAAPDAGRAA